MLQQAHFELTAQDGSAQFFCPGALVLEAPPGPRRGWRIYHPRGVEALEHAGLPRPPAVPTQLLRTTKHARVSWTSVPDNLSEINGINIMQHPVRILIIYNLTFNWCVLLCSSGFCVISPCEWIINAFQKFMLFDPPVRPGQSVNFCFVEYYGDAPRGQHHEHQQQEEESIPNVSSSAWWCAEQCCRLRSY